jgi:hypothetical protein
MFGGYDVIKALVQAHGVRVADLLQAFMVTTYQYDNASVHTRRLVGIQ